MMAIAVLKLSGVSDVRESLAIKIKAARLAMKMSTRAVAAELSKRFSMSHATIANYESGKSVPPVDVLASIAELLDRPLNWFLEKGDSFVGVRYRNLKSRIKAADLHQFESHVQQWIDAYLAVETRLNRVLKPSIDRIVNAESYEPDALSREVRRRLGISEEEPVSSIVEVLEAFAIRVIEQPTPLRIDGLAARYGNENIVVLNPLVSNDRVRMNAGHELAHILYDDCESESTEDKTMEQRAFEFSSHLLLPNNQLKKAFAGKSMVRLVQYKEKFGISLAAMVYRAEKRKFITKSEAKLLWIEFAKRGWKSKEPGTVRADRATRLEQLIDEAIQSGIMSHKEIADIAGVRTDEIRTRINQAIGMLDEDGLSEEEPETIQFPRS